MYISIAKCMLGIIVDELTHDEFTHDIAEKKTYIEKGTRIYNTTTFLVFQVQNNFILYSLLLKKERKKENIRSTNKFPPFLIKN